MGADANEAVLLNRDRASYSERLLVDPALEQLTLDVATTAFVGMPLGADADRGERCVQRRGARRHSARSDAGPGRSLGADDLGFDDLDALGTLDLVMRECIRLVARVPSLPRLTVRDTDLLGYHIPRGTMVDLFPTLTHRLDAYWTRPDDFDPLRFSTARRPTTCRFRCTGSATPGSDPTVDRSLLGSIHE